MIFSFIADILRSSIFEDIPKLACIISMMSVCLNTPHTFSFFPPLYYIVFLADAIVTVVFLIEAIVKIVTNGLITVS